MRTVSKVSLSVGVILIALVVTALLTYPQPTVRVTVFDPRIRVLSVKILRGTNDDFYMGNQLERSVRQFLGQGMQLNVAPLQNLGRLDFQRNDTYRLAILYRWESAEVPPRNVIAELVDSSGTVKQLPGAFAGQNPYCAVFVLDDAPPIPGSYRLRLRAAELGANMKGIPGTSRAWIQMRSAELGANTQPLLGSNQSEVEFRVSVLESYRLRVRTAELRKNMPLILVPNLAEVEIRKLPPLLSKP